MPYLDTSILGSYYCPERLSAVVNAALTSISDPIISPLVEVEFCSLLSLKIRTSAMNRAAAIAILAQFRLHVANDVYKIVEVSEREYELARDWLGRFDSPLRTLDALHLATALAYGQDIWTTDKAMGLAGRQIGVKTRLIEQK